MNRPIVVLPDQLGSADQQPDETGAELRAPAPTRIAGPAAEQTGTEDPYGIAETLRASAAAARATHAPAAALAAAGSGQGGGSATAATTGRVGGVRIGLVQIVCWQLAVVAVAVTVPGPRSTLIATAAGAVVVIAATTVRIRGAWLYVWAGIGLRYLLRTRRADLPESTHGSDSTGPAAVAGLLGLWLGPTTVDTTVVRDKPLGLISHPGGLSALLRLESADALRPALDRLLTDGARGVSDTLDEQPVDIGTQLLVHLSTRHDREPRIWVAVGAARSAELNTDEQLTLVVRNAVRRVHRVLDRAGVTPAAADDLELAAAVIGLAHAGHGRGHVRERWSTWSAGPVSQACLRLTGFAGLETRTAILLVETLGGTSTGAAVTVSVGTRTDARRGESDLHDALVRVAASSAGGLDAAVAVVERIARAYGLHPERLDGRHGPGTAASLPIARTQL